MSRYNSPPMSDLSARDKILNVALCLAQTKGYNAFSYRDLANEIGIKTSSIHYHFPKKEDLALALIAHYRDIFAGMLAGIDGRSDTPVKKFRAYLELFIDTARDGEKVCLGGMFASEILAFGQDMRKQVQQFFVDNESWLEDLIREGIAQGDFQIKDSPKKAAQDIFAALEGVLLVSRAFHDQGRVAQLGSRLENMLTLTG